MSLRAQAKAWIVAAAVACPSSWWPFLSAVVRFVWPGVRGA